jgi:hypothetical protein
MTVVIAAMLVVLAAVVPQFAEAGCLGEDSACRDCARKMLKRAMWRFDLGGIRDANIAMWDCDIDLYHCILFGQHHEGSCAI